MLSSYFRQSKLLSILTATLEQSLISEQDGKGGEKVTPKSQKSGKGREGEGAGRGREAYFDRWDLSQDLREVKEPSRYLFLCPEFQAEKTESEKVIGGEPEFGVLVQELARLL